MSRASPSLVEDEQELGAACIDMGGGSTGISIFMKKHMIYADSVRMGGDHVTSDISKGLQVPLAVAERIKTKHGGVHATGMDDREMIEIGGDSGDWEKDRRQISRTELIGIMRPRVEEILEEVRARLDAAGFDHLPSQQIVLTGGASQIPGLDGLADPHPGPARAAGPPAAGAGPAAGGDRARHFPRRGAVPVCRASAGRMVGFRHSDRTLSGAVAEKGLQMVQGQLVNRNILRHWRNTAECGTHSPYFVGDCVFFS